MVSMASFSSSTVMWKLTVLLVVAATAAVLVSGERHQGGPGGRFLVDSEDSDQLENYGGAGGRRLLNANLCGIWGSPPDFLCSSILRGARQPRCCVLPLTGVRICKDVGGTDDKNCGACNNVCGYRIDCCNGQCVNKVTDRNNCGKCGNRCPSNTPCRGGNCGYNGKD